MRKYELSISADYVPRWGTVEAVREFSHTLPADEDLMF